MKKIWLVGLLVGITLSVIGAEPVKVIMATTDDGRRVILMPDGNWNFVEGVPEAVKPDTTAGRKQDGKKTDCREKLWAEMVSYFSSWELELAEKDSFALNTKWHNLDVTRPGTGFYRVKASINLKDDCSFNLNIKYQTCSWETGIPNDQSNKGCNDIGWSDLQKTAKVFKTAQRVVEFDAKLRADLEVLSAKAKQ